jgi:hypothetical protein
MLRACAWAGGIVLCFSGIVIVAAVQSIWPAGVELLAFGVLILLSLSFEQHYREGARRSQGEWQTTEERFIDPTSGKLVQVRYNPRTGERRYENVD